MSCFKRAFLALLLVSCTQNPIKESTNASQNNNSWPAGMRSMANDLNKLMPYVFSEREFSDIENKKKIQKFIGNFKNSVEVVPQHIGEALLGKDPLIKYSIGRLRSNTHLALQAFSEGQVGYARNVLKENLGLCFSCHTSTQFGPENTDTSFLVKNKFRISPNERAEYYVATRQFDKAISLLEAIVDTPPQAFNSIHVQVEALRMYLSLQVRVKKNPTDASHVIEKFLSNKNLPYFIAVDAEAWQKNLQEWVRADKKQTKNSIAEGRELLSKARKIQDASGYQAGYVAYLRASSVLHEALRSATDEKSQAEIYYNLGESYESMAGSGTWELPEVYFEACIRNVPKSDLAKKCFRALEKTVFLGYTGSAGVFVPKAERERLNELKAASGIE